MNPHNPSPAPQQSSLPARRMKADGTNIDYGYSTHGELESVTIPGEGLLSVNPFNWRVPAQITLPSGTQQNKHYDGLLDLTATLFIKTRNSNNLDIFAYYHHDHLGTPVQATDKQGNVVWAASYHAFGLASIITPAATPDIPTITSNLRLPGQYADEETGLYYNLNRYYDPATGNYRTRDPIGIEGGENQYAYVHGNPISYTDPYGLLSTDDVWGAVYSGTGWSPSQTTVNAVAGLGDGFSGGLTQIWRQSEGLDESVDKCSAAYRAGGVASFAFGAGRLMYAGRVAYGAAAASSGAAASAFRSGLRVAFGGGKTFHAPNLSKYETDVALRLAAGRTSKAYNSWGAAAAGAGGYGAAGCGCDK